MEEEWLPFYINVRGFRVFVFGGGTVAERRAIMFAGKGANVCVYSLEFTDGLKEASERLPNLTLNTIDLEQADLQNLIHIADIVVVATNNNELNRRILDEAIKAKKLVNYPPHGLSGNLIVPFRGETSYRLKIAVTSLGETGIAARHALLKALDCLEDSYIRNLYFVMKEFKKWLKSSVPSHKVRYRIYFKVDENPDFQKLVKEGRVNEALELAKRIALKFSKEEHYP